MPHHYAAIILMGGEGRRFGTPHPKQFHLLNEKKIYRHTLETFESSQLFDQITLVCHPDWIAQVQQEISPSITLIAGGPTRQASSFLGIQACQAEFVMIHDAVRPFVSLEILQRNLTAVHLHSAVDTCIPSADTIVHAPGKTLITTIPPRDHYLRGQTPQTFDYKLILEAHQKTRQQEATDDCSLVLELGHPIAIVAGDESNIKITTELDVEWAEFLLKNGYTCEKQHH